MAEYFTYIYFHTTSRKKLGEKKMCVTWDGVKFLAWFTVLVWPRHSCFLDLLSKTEISGKLLHLLQAELAKLWPWQVRWVRADEMPLFDPVWQGDGGGENE